MNNDKKIICHPVTNKENDSFIGIRIKNEEIHFYHPESYDLAPKDNLREFRNDIINIIRSISFLSHWQKVNLLLMTLSTTALQKMKALR